MSPAAQFAGRKAARESRERLRDAIDSLEATLLERTIKAAELTEELNKSYEGQVELAERVEQARKERDAAAMQLRALRAKGGAF